MKKTYEFKPDYKVPPGKTIEETMEFYNISKQCFAKKIGLTVKDTELLLEGKKEITEKIAQKIEKLLEIPAHFLMNLERNFRS